MIGAVGGDRGLLLLLLVLLDTMRHHLTGLLLLLLLWLSRTLLAAVRQLPQLLIPTPSAAVLRVGLS